MNEPPSQYFTGLSGFALSATLLTVKSDDLACGLIGSALTNRTAGIELPTVKQFLGVMDSEELSSLKGESGHKEDDCQPTHRQVPGVVERPVGHPTYFARRILFILSQHFL
jgi:hypothetical protein